MYASKISAFKFFNNYSGASLEGHVSHQHNESQSYGYTAARDVDAFSAFDFLIWKNCGNRGHALTRVEWNTFTIFSLSRKNLLVFNTYIGAIIVHGESKLYKTAFYLFFRQRPPVYERTWKSQWNIHLYRVDKKYCRFNGWNPEHNVIFFSMIFLLQCRKWFKLWFGDTTAMLLYEFRSLKKKNLAFYKPPLIC